MIRKILIITLIMCFSAVNGFSFPKKEVSGNEDVKKEIDALKKSQEETSRLLKELMIPKTGNTEVKPNDTPRSDVKQNGDMIVPLTWDTARLFEDELYKLDFYINKNLEATAKEEIKNQGIVKDGKILGNNEKNLPEEKLTINNNVPVKITKFSLSPKNQANLDVYFSSQSVVLKFKRNSRDYFQLESVTRNTRNFTFGGEFLLCVHDERGSSNRTSAQTSTSTSTTSSATRPKIPEDIMLKPGQRTYLTRDPVVKYLSDNNKSGVSTRDIKAIVEHYINESKPEGINHDIAIAQMCYATNNLNNKTLFNNMNYADLSLTGAKLRGKTWNGKFPRSKIGVRAHIQHLKGYATVDEFPREEIIDPRFHLLQRGKGNTLHELSKYWVKKFPDKYEKEIKDILEKLYNYQENYR